MVRLKLTVDGNNKLIQMNLIDFFYYNFNLQHSPSSFLCFILLFCIFTLAVRLFISIYRFHLEIYKYAIKNIQ